MAINETLLAVAQTIRDESEVGANTASRVGGLLVDIINEFGEYLTENDLSTYLYDLFASLDDDSIIQWYQSRVIVLDAMGEDLDGESYTPSSGDRVFYNANGYQITDCDSTDYLSGTRYKANDGSIYINKITGNIYRWTGSAMEQIGGTSDSSSSTGVAISYDATEMHTTITIGTSTAEQTETPTISVSASSSSATVTITASEGTVYYTTDGTSPTTSSTVYTAAFTVTTAGTIKAIAKASGKTISSVASATIEGTETPVLTMTSTSSTATITATCSDSTAAVTLIVDGTTYTGTGSASASITKTESSQTVSVSAYAQASGELVSSTTTATYTIDAVSDESDYLIGTSSEAITTFYLNGSAIDSSLITNTATDSGYEFKIDCSGYDTIYNDGSNNVFGATGNANNTYSGTNTILSITQFPQDKPIGAYAFGNLSNMTSIDLTGVTTIGRAAFGGTGLTSVTIPSGVTFAGTSVFYKCASLTSVTLAGNNFNGQASAFLSCSALTSVSLSSSITTIPATSFSQCTAIAEVTIPSSVTKINNNAFNNTNGGSGTTFHFSSASVPTLGNATSLGSAAIVYVPTDYVSTYEAAWGSGTSYEYTIEEES